MQELLNSVEQKISSVLLKEYVISGRCDPRKNKEEV